MSTALHRNNPETAARLRAAFERHVARWDAQQARLQARWKAAEMAGQRSGDGEVGATSDRHQPEAFGLAS